MILRHRFNVENIHFLSRRSKPMNAQKQANGAIREYFGRLTPLHNRTAVYLGRRQVPYTIALC